MALDPGLGGMPFKPAPTQSAKPLLISQPVPSIETGIDITAATAYRGYYYEIVQNLDGNWLWAVYLGTQVSWGLSGVLVSGGTSPTEADALTQVTTIIDNLSIDDDYVAPPVQEDATIGGDPIFPVIDLGPLDPDYVPPSPSPSPSPTNGNGTSPSPPIYDFFPHGQQVSFTRIVGIAALAVGFSFVSQGMK